MILSNTVRRNIFSRFPLFNSHPNCQKRKNLKIFWACAHTASASPQSGCRSKLEINKRHWTGRWEQFERQKCANVCRLAMEYCIFRLRRPCQALPDSCHMPSSVSTPDRCTAAPSVCSVSTNTARHITKAYTPCPATVAPFSRVIISFSFRQSQPEELTTHRITIAHRPVHCCHWFV